VKASILCILASLALAAPAAAAGRPGDPTRSDACRRGAPACVDRVIAEMERRWRPLDRACDHRAPFALLYLRTTQEFKRSLRTLRYRRPGAVVREDAAFARRYFEAFDAYEAGRSVPAAWRVAFDAAAAHTQTSAGDTLLGVNAHINRDLPIVLRDLQRTGHPITRRDHFLVDEVLRRVDALAEVARRYDPAPPADPAVAVRLVVGWRASAWTTYERLRGAPTRAAREGVRAGVEVSSTVLGQGIRVATLGSWAPGGSSCARAR
jgi:hypothetical protein